jgi:hypothetical protein
VGASEIWLGSGATLDNPHGFLALWMAVLALTAATNTVILVLGARERKEAVLSASMKAALIAIAPAFVAAGAFTCLYAGLPSDPLNQLTLTIIWAVCYGLGLLATSHFAPRSLTVLGAAFLTAGLATMLAFRYGGESFMRALDGRTASIFMAGTFGLFHFIYAVCAWPRKRGEPEP